MHTCTYTHIKTEIDLIHGISLKLIKCYIGKALKFL